MFRAAAIIALVLLVIARVCGNESTFALASLVAVAVMFEILLSATSFGVAAARF